MKRAGVLQQINLLLDKKCQPCEIRKELNQKHRCIYSKIDGYCIKECPVGKQLQALGKELVKETKRKGA